MIFTWKRGASKESIARAVSGLRALPKQIPEIKALSVGEDLSLTSGEFGAELGVQSQNGDLGLVMDFNDRDAWQHYNGHEAHRRLVHGPLGELVGGRISVQYETPPK